MATKNKSNKIELSRIYDAPVEVVWDAWTDPKKAAHWWGPRGFTITTHSKDLKPGGHWHYTMHGPDGTDYPNKTKYFEVEKCAKLVYDHGANDDQPALFRVTVTFKEVKGKTRMDMSMAFATPEVAEQMGQFIKKAGGNSTWDRLDEYLCKNLENKEKFTINRSFSVSIEKMYDVWTDPKHFTKWLPPTGFDMEFISADIRPGGSSFYMMYNDQGLKMYGKIHYLEMNRPTGLKYTQEFSDKDGQQARHPMAPTWPAQMLTTITFTEEGPDQTRVTVNWEVFGKATQEEMNTFIQGRAGMTGGWTGSFDKLDAYLEKN